VKPPFEKFKILDTVRRSEFVVECLPRRRSNEQEIEQREFIRDAIREKLERSEKREDPEHR